MWTDSLCSNWPGPALGNFTTVLIILKMRVVLTMFDWRGGSVSWTLSLQAQMTHKTAFNGMKGVRLPRNISQGTLQRPQYNFGTSCRDINDFLKCIDPPPTSYSTKTALLSIAMIRRFYTGPKNSTSI